MASKGRGLTTDRSVGTDQPTLNPCGRGLQREGSFEHSALCLAPLCGSQGWGGTGRQPGVSPDTQWLPLLADPSRAWTRHFREQRSAHPILEAPLVFGGPCLCCPEPLNIKFFSAEKLLVRPEQRPPLRTPGTGQQAGPVPSLSMPSLGSAPAAGRATVPPKSLERVGVSSPSQGVPGAGQWWLKPLPPGPKVLELVAGKLGAQVLRGEKRL